MTSTISDLMVAAERFGGHPAVEDDESRLTYSELLGASRGFGAALASSGVRHGDRVAIWAPNCAEWIVALLGLSGIGAVLVPINTRFKGFEAADILYRSRARVLVTVVGFLDNDFVGMLRSTGVTLPDLERIIVAKGTAPDRTVSWDDFVSGASGESGRGTDRGDRRVGHTLHFRDHGCTQRSGFDARQDRPGRRRLGRDDRARSR